MNNLFSTEIVGHYQSEENAIAECAYDGITCFIFITTEQVKTCIKSNPLEALRRISTGLDNSKNLSHYKWELISHGIKSKINIYTKNDIVTSCEIVNPTLLEPWYPKIDKSHIETYLSAPEETLKKDYNDLGAIYKTNEKDPIKYIAIHTPKREIKFCSAKSTYTDKFKVVYLDSEKLLEKWKNQALTYKQEKNLATKFCEKFGLIEQKKHWRSKADYKIFAKKNDIHITYFMPNELAEGVCLYDGYIEVTNGRHRIANAIYSGAPFVPVFSHVDEVIKLEKELGWL